VKDGISYNMDSLGIWVNFLRISSPNSEYKKLKVRSSPITQVTGHTESERTVSIELLLESDTKEEYELLFSKVYDIFFSPEPLILVRDSHPGELIKVINEGVYTPEDITDSDGEINFELTMIDPFIYGPEKTADFESGLVVLNNQGKAPASPIFEIDVNDNVTHIDIIGEDGYFRIGQPEPIDKPVYEQLTLVGNYPLTSLVGWTTANQVEDGHVTGEMEATPSGFRPKLFGAAITPHKFQGPAVRRSISSLQDFRMDIDVELLNKSSETGMLEIYLKDAAGNTVIKIGIEDIWSSLAKVQAKLQLGNQSGRKVTHMQSASTASAWNDFKGTLRLHRVGNRIRPYFAIVQPDGKHVWVYSSYLYTDQLEEYQAPIVEVVIAMRIWPTTQAASMVARNLKFYRYNSEPEGIPVISSVGDKVIIDTNDSSIRINGEDRKSLKDFGASFFKLKKGINTILLEPSNKLSGRVRYRERGR